VRSRRKWTWFGKWQKSPGLSAGLSVRRLHAWIRSVASKEGWRPLGLLSRKADPVFHGGRGLSDLRSILEGAGVYVEPLNESDPEAVGAAQGLGQIELGEHDLNSQTNATVAATGATETGELAVHRVNRLAEELSHAMEDWHQVTGTRFIAHVFAADTGRGVWFQNEIHGVRSMSISLGDVIDTLDEAQDHCEAVFMDTIQRGKDALQELRGPRQ
jgi:hypothetical protein